MTMFAKWIEAGGRIEYAPKMTDKLKDAWKNQTYRCFECDEILTPVNEGTRNEKDYIRPHFNHSKDSTCKLKENESDEHKEAKYDLLDHLLYKNIKLNYYGALYEIKQDEVKGVEITRGDNRADILVEFKEPNLLFGQGIAFEVAFTEKFDSISEKMDEWNSKGYMVIRIGASMKHDYINKGIQIKSNYLESLFKNSSKQLKLLNDAITEIRSFNIPAHQKMEISTTCNNCSNCLGYGSPAKTRDGQIILDQIACWLWRTKGWQSKPDIRSINQICNFWNGSK